VAFLDASVGLSGPIAVLRRRWIEGLVIERDGPAFDTGVEAVEAAARALEAAGYLGLAVEVYADADIISARAGRASASRQRALEVCAEIGYQPVLGPLPETRWLTPSPTTA
jgi:hypothetical protein